MHLARREPGQRPLEREQEDAQDQVDGLQDRVGLYGNVEVFGQEVEEDLWPEDAFERSCYLVWDAC